MYNHNPDSGCVQDLLHSTTGNEPPQTEGLSLESPQPTVYEVRAKYFKGVWPPKTIVTGWSFMTVWVECDSPLSVHQAAKTQISKRMEVERRRIEVLTVKRVERNPRLAAAQDKAVDRD